MGGNCCATTGITHQETGYQLTQSLPEGSRRTSKQGDSDTEMVLKMKPGCVTIQERDSHSLGRTSDQKTRTPHSVSGSLASLGHFADHLSKISSLTLVTSMNAVSPVVQRMLDKYPTPSLSTLGEMPTGFAETLPESGPWLVHPFKATYFGQTENDVPHGFCRIVTSKGAVLEGYFDNGELTGYARIFEQTGQTYIGGFKNKRKHGQGLFVDKKGQEIKANWEQGVTNGPIEVRDVSGKLIFKGQTSYGKRCGFGIEWNPYERYTYEGSFENDKYHGKGSKTYEDGRAYKGGFKNGFEHGEGVLIKVDGRCLKGHFEFGKPKGEILVVSENGEQRTVQI